MIIVYNISPTKDKLNNDYNPKLNGQSLIMYLWINEPLIFSCNIALLFMINLMDCMWSFTLYDEKMKFTFIRVLSEW